MNQPTLQKQVIQIVSATLKRHNGNRTTSARELGVSSRTMRTWISRHDELDEFRRKK